MSAAFQLTLLIPLAVVAIEIARLIAAYRRAKRLNRALHELRRPLQSITLSIEGEHPDLVCANACMDQVRGALEELDAVVNRRPFTRTQVQVALAQIAEALEDRWRFAGVHVSAPVGGRALDADPVALGAALDNLVANAVEHGGGDVSVRALSSPGSVRFEVRDSGGSRDAVEERAENAEASVPSLLRDPRHGHGLAVAAAHAADHGGTLIPPMGLAGGTTVAALSLPAPAEPVTR